MQQSAAVVELISGYETYADVGELNISAAADAPATSIVCASAVKSSGYCIGASISLISATIDRLT